MSGIELDGDDKVTCKYMKYGTLLKCRSRYTSEPTNAHVFLCRILKLCGVPVPLFRTPSQHSYPGNNIGCQVINSSTGGCNNVK